MDKFEYIVFILASFPKKENIEVVRSRKLNVSGSINDGITGDWNDLDRGRHYRRQVHHVFNRSDRYPINFQFSFLDSRCTMVSYRDRMTWVSAGTPNAVFIVL